MTGDPEIRTETVRPVRWSIHSESWRPPATNDPQTRLPRRVRRWGLVLLVLGLMGLLAALVLRPLWHPRVHFVFAALTGDAPLEHLAAWPAPLPFIDGDAAALQQVAEAASTLIQKSGLRRLPEFGGTNAVAALRAALADTQTSSRDIAIVYLVAHGVSHDGIATLRWSLSPEAPLGGGVPLAEIVEALTDNGAELTLLVLDAGRIPVDPRLGMLINEFPRLLQEAIQKTGDRRLWVLASHSAGEQSHVSHAWQQSVFNHFVTRGLGGEADTNGNQIIDLAELSSFVQQQVSIWVREETAGQASQTPQLIWGGGADLPGGEAPTLVPATHSTRIATTRPQTGKSKSDGATKTDGTNEGEADQPPPLPFATSALIGDLQLPSRRPAAVTLPAAGPAATPPAAVPPSGPPSDASPTTAGSKPDAPPAAEPPAIATAPPAAPSANPPATAVASPPPPEAPAPIAIDDLATRPLPELFAEAWELRDQLERRDVQRVSPIDYAPHLWRTFESRLLLLEQHYRGGAAEASVRPYLVELLMPMRGLAAGTPRLRPASENLIDRIAALQPRRAAAPRRPVSLAEWEGHADADDATSPNAATNLTRSFDQLLAEGTAEQYRVWLAALPPDAESYYEIRLAQQLAEVPGLDWSVIRLALEARRAGERVAVAPWAHTDWLREAIDEADRARRDGERELLDEIAPGRVERARELLQAAVNASRRAEGVQQLLDRATELNHDITYRLPYWIQWHDAAGASRTVKAPSFGDLQAILVALRALDATLQSPAPENIPRLAHQSELLRELVARVQRIVDGHAAAAQRSGSVMWRGEALLGTPLPRRPLRMRLLHEAVTADPAPPTGNERSRTERTYLAMQRLSTEGWQDVLNRARLEVELAEFTTVPAPTGSPMLKALQVNFAEFSESLIERETAATATPTQNRDARWTTVRACGRTLADFHDARAARMDLAVRQATRDAAADGTEPTLAAAAQSLRVMDPRDTRRPGNASPSEALRLWTAARQQNFYRERFALALADAPARDVAFLRQAAASSDVPLSRAAANIEVTGTEFLSLIERPDGVVELTLRPNIIAPAPVWVILDYDPARLDVRGSGETPLYVETELRDRLQRQWSGQTLVETSLSETATDETAAPAVTDSTADTQSPVAYPYRPDRAGLPPTRKLYPGETETVQLTVRGKDNSRQSAPLIVKVVCGESYVRHAVTVELPYPETVELAVLGTPGSWSRGDSDFVLHPFPNLGTEYQLALINRGLTERVVDVALLAPGRPVTSALPHAALPRAQADQLLATLAPVEAILPPLTEVHVPADGQPVLLPFPEPMGAAAAPPPAAASPATGAAAAEAPTATPPGATAAPLKPLSYGLLLAVTDRERGRVMLQMLQLAPQRPRRYVTATVGYNVDAQRVSIWMTPVDPALLPPGGVNVRAELAGGLSDGAEAHLEGRIAAPDFGANLSIEVPEQPGKMVTLWLHVDGYPRAFLYRIPCDRTADNIPEWTDAREVRLQVLDSGGPYPTAIASIPVEAQLDAPLGAFESGNDFAEVGIDIDQDRELEGESPLRLTMDRQVSVGWEGAAPAGKIVLRTQVGDHQLQLPTAGVRNARVDLLGRIVAGGKTNWSRPVEAVIDGEVPRVHTPRLNPPSGTVISGSDLLVSVVASDGSLSGIERVEAGFDLERIGRFAEGAKPILALPAPEGRWVAKLPTAPLKPGRYTALVRATDRVGNVSDYAKVRVTIITPEEAAERAAAKTNIVSGAALYNTRKIAGATVKLEKVVEKPNEEPTFEPTDIPDATTDAQGAYTFPQVPVGKYRLTATATVNNQNRTAIADVTVKAPPALPENVLLKFPFP